MKNKFLNGLKSGLLFAALMLSNSDNNLQAMNTQNSKYSSDRNQVPLYKDINECFLDKKIKIPLFNKKTMYMTFAHLEDKYKSHVAKFLQNNIQDGTLRSWVFFLTGIQSITVPSISSIESILLFDNHKLNEYHNFIQLAFPTMKQSRFANQDFYLGNRSFYQTLSNIFLTQGQMGQLIFTTMQSNIEAVFLRIIGAFSFTYDNRTKTYYHKGKICNEKSIINFAVSDEYYHYLLRFSRILESLSIFWLEDHAKWFYSILKNNKTISNNSKEFFINAIHFGTMQRFPEK